MPFTVASYNVLADGYIRAKYYPRTPLEVFAPERRRAAVAQRVAGLGADVACLQEVEAETLAALAARLRGHRAIAEPKRGKPDAVATLTRLPILEQHALVHDDGTGHVSLLLVLDAEGRRLGVANNHVRWDPPGASVGVRQVEALLDLVSRIRCDGWILAGDFNADPTSPAVAAVFARGFRDPFSGRPGAFTCNANDEPKQIDYLFHDAALRASPEPLPAIDAKTALPSLLEPSDHLPVVARFELVAP